MSKTTLVKIPKLKAGDDKAIAALLVQKHDASVEATKVVFDGGLLCFYIKENLPHGQFGPWLQAHCPEKMWRVNNKTGKAVASSTLSWQMGLTKSLVEKCGTTVEKLLSQIPNTWEFGVRGQFLQMPQGSTLLLKAPEPITHVHAEATKAAEGKTAYQLFLEFKQGDDRFQDEADENPTPRPAKRGRRAGEGGATKEQREAAAAREEVERLESMQAKADEVAEWLLENAGVKGFARLDEIAGGEKTARKLADAVAYANTFFTNLNRSKK